MEITIKNMVCQRCIASVRDIFEKEKVLTASVTLGKVVTAEALTEQCKEKLKEALKVAGFEWIDDYKHKLIEEVKALVIQQINHPEQMVVNWSDFVSKKLNHEYRYISQLFSEIHGITLEQYILRLKIEKVKELIRYDQLTISEIAYHLHYSSAAHLSAQFKKITGMTPSDFKKSGQNRTPLDLI